MGTVLLTSSIKQDSEADSQRIMCVQELVNLPKNLETMMQRVRAPG